MVLKPRVAPLRGAPQGEDGRLANFPCLTRPRILCERGTKVEAHLDERQEYLEQCVAVADAERVDGVRSAFPQVPH